MTLLVDADFGGPAGSRIAGRNAGVGAELPWLSDGEGLTPLMDGLGNVVQESDNREAILALPPAMFTGPFSVALRLAAVSTGENSLNVITIRMGGLDVFLMNQSGGSGAITVGAIYAGISILEDAVGKQIWYIFDPVEQRIIAGVGDEIGRDEDVIMSSYGSMYFSDTNLKLVTYAMDEGAATVKLSNLKVDGIGSLNSPDFWTEFAGAREVP